MSALSVVGALLCLAGVTYMAGAAIARGRMSDPRPNPEDNAGVTIEPRRKGVGFLGIGANWPGLLLVGLGAAMLLSPLIF